MMPLALFGTLGAPEIVLILVILVFLFGARRLPELAQALGKSIRGFRSSVRSDEEITSGEPDNDAGQSKQ